MAYLTVGGDASHGTAAASGREMGDYFAEQVARPKSGRSHDLPGKRALDLSFAILGLLILAPVLIVIALFIRLETRGPVVFRQTRGGLNGRSFRIYKFRTLCVLENDCDVRQVTYDDERVTRVGRFLRAWSLDELPQLFNVLVGDMSLVGPRPHAVAHDKFYRREIPVYDRRFEVKPGITGWAQVNGARGETPTVKHMLRRVELDLWYVENRSLSLDFQILAETLLLQMTGLKVARFRGGPFPLSLERL